ncbi:helix-turn-helix transcriptional regulator [Acinetobacter schindleri]|uniref:helix-turn-helix transcriptional regulator n=1 Tax=Acinetobacter schindleri TaxID=108981 RepID=UPI0033410CD1
MCISIPRAELRYAYSWKSQFLASLIMFITIVSIDKMFIKLKDVCCIVNASKNTIYAIQQRDPSFPKPVKFGHKKQSRVFYRESEIRDWVLKVSSSNFHVESEK